MKLNNYKKSKKILSLASVLLGASIFVSCTNTNSKVIFSEYWTENANIATENITEELEYAVAFEKGAGLNMPYSLEYTNGTYITRLKTEQSDGKTVYVYETDFSITVHYQYKGETVDLQDSVKTTVKFEKASSALYPLSSHKEIVSHSPNNGAAEKVADCYEEYKYNIDTTYDNAGKGVCVITKPDEEENNSISSEFSIDTKKYNYLDNEQLLFALRGLSPASISSSTFSVYNAFTDSVQKIKVAFSSETGADFEFLKDGVSVKDTISYYSADISIDSQNPGATQTAWVAKTVDPSKNTYRNVVLKLKTPISYNLGTLVYTLKSANFSK